MVIELDGASGSRQVHELDGGQDLDRRPVIPEAVAVVIELTGRCGSRPGDEPGLAAIVALGLVAKPPLRSRASCCAPGLDRRDELGQDLDRLPVVPEGVAVVIELDGASGSRQVHELDGGQDLDRRPVIPEPWPW